MAAGALLDTGPIVALVDPDDPWHQSCVEALTAVRLPLLTSEAVLTELFYLVRRNPKALDAAWTFVLSGAVTIAPISDADLPALYALITQYRDHPMDFADATLVHLARRESLTTILTVDHDDFETYRIDRGARFRILPARTVKPR